MRIPSRSRTITRIAATLLAVLLLSAPQLSQSSPAREFSKAGKVFQEAKNGIVTVFSSVGHGSGFLADDSGLVVTNSHVVREASDHLRVKFGPKQIVEGKVIVNDRENDVAVLWVNLKNIDAATPLKMFNPEKEDLVVAGEKIIVVGTPLIRETLAQSMTEGVVSKFDGKNIYHDANTTGGNSGGPILNFDGQVVGIHTFGFKSVRGPGGAVPITLAIPSIQRAKTLIKSEQQPSSELLPDIPEVPYPISKWLKERPEFFRQRKQKKYNFSSNYFGFSIETPPQGYAQMIKVQNLVLKPRKKRAKKKGFKVSDDEYNYKNKAYYNYSSPVVTIKVIPKPKLTAGCLMAQSTGFLAATTLTVFTAGLAAPLMAVPFMYNKKEMKKDFLKLKLVDESGEIVAIPIETGRLPYVFDEAKTTEFYYEEILDKSYYGFYRFDAREFDTDKKLSLVVGIEGNDKDITVKFPERVKQQILEDFKPYWEYVANLKDGEIPKKQVEAKIAKDDPKQVESNVSGTEGELEESSAEEQINEAESLEAGSR